MKRVMHYTAEEQVQRFYTALLVLQETRENFSDESQSGAFLSMAESIIKTDLQSYAEDAVESCRNHINRMQDSKRHWESILNNITPKVSEFDN